MRRFLLVTLTLIVSWVPVLAQTPQYKFTKWTTGQPVGGFDFRLQANQRWQSIYHPSDFATAPKGVIKYLYVRSGGLTNGAPVTYYDLTIKMGYTTESEFRHPGKDSFITGLTTVFTAPSVTFPGADTVGKWIRIPFNSGNFFYDPGKNFVVEISNGAVPLHGFLLMYATTNPEYRSGGGGQSPDCATYSQAMEFGFDLAPTSVSESGSNPEIVVFPNPAHNEVAVSISSAMTGNGIEISLKSITGQELRNQRFEKNQARILAKMNLNGLPAGLYFLNVHDRQQLYTRKLRIE